MAKPIAQAAAKPVVVSTAFMRVRASQPRVPPLAGGGVHGFDPNHRTFKPVVLGQQRRRMSTTRVRSWDNSLKQQLQQRAHPAAASQRGIFPPTKWQSLVQKDAPMDAAGDMDIKLQSFVAKVMQERTAAAAPVRKP